jgi:uncharacterized protein (TIGR03382 family)
MAACLVSSSALANSTGVTGRSGKQGQNATCTSSGCHSGGGTAPTVTLEGPDSLEPGKTGNYRIIISGGPGAEAGFNVAVSSDDATLNAGAGSQKLSRELTHSNPRPFSNNQAVFDFTLMAPANAGTITLFGAGNSSNNNGVVTGDASALVQKTISVGGGDNGGGNDDDGGCAAAGGAPLLGAALLMLGARLRRRQ